MAYIYLSIQIVKYSLSYSQSSVAAEQLLLLGSCHPISHWVTQKVA